MEEKIQKLSEGYDFIEESIGNSTEPLSFSEVSDVVISEGKEKSSPYKILGKACGCFAPIGEFSRNKRLYSNDLWPTVLANEAFKQRLKNREVFGCLGHADKLVDDRDIQEGKVSHIVTCLDVREDVNGKPYLYGELEILDTPAGRILEGMYKGGANLYVSSRAAGKLIPVPGQDYCMVRPDQYHVHCFDVVARPGFLQARPAFEAVSSEPVQPQIHESVEEKISEQPVQESSEVSELKSQVEQLAKIIEKVVDDVYEEETPTEPKEKVLEKKPEEAPQQQEQPIAPVEKEKTNEALADFVSLMADTNISEEVFSEILDIMAKSIKETK